jgi:hypothetical protein
MALAMMLSAVGELASENMTLTTYYPAPSGVYAQLITTGNTYLARDTAANSQKVGIGTTAPGALLTVVNGDNTANNILQVFPRNLSQGVALGYNYIREIGSNGNNPMLIDAQGPGALVLQSVGTGNVTIGRGVNGAYGLIPSYAAWAAYGTGDGGAAIYNDAGAYRTLMLVGNNSAGGVRQVSVWDQLNVNGNAFVNGNVTAQGSGGNRGYVSILNNNTGCMETDVTQGPVCGGGLYASWQPGFNVQGWSYENRGGQVLVQAAAGQTGTQVWGINPASGNAQWMTLKKDDSVAHIYCCPL